MPFTLADDVQFSIVPPWLSATRPPDAPPTSALRLPTTPDTEQPVIVLFLLTITMPPTVAAPIMFTSLRCRFLTVASSTQPKKPLYQPDTSRTPLPNGSSQSVRSGSVEWYTLYTVCPAPSNVPQKRRVSWR